MIKFVINKQKRDIKSETYEVTFIILPFNMTSKVKCLKLLNRRISKKQELYGEAKTKRKTITKPLTRKKS